MDHLTLAERRYQQIVPDPQKSWTDFPFDKLSVWLEDDVCVAVEDYVQRPRFREEATWSLRALAPGATTPERALVEAVDRALVAAAKALQQLYRHKPMQETMRLQNPAQPSVAEEVVEISDQSVRTISRKMELMDHLKILLAQVDNIASRIWRDLVCPEDYLEPQGGWMEKARDRKVGAGEFIVSLNPKLHAIGDFVTRCLMQRVDILYGIVGTCRIKCQAAVRATGRRDPRRMDSVENAWKDLAEKILYLRSMCQIGPDSRLRDSCTILLQVYAAFHRKPDLAWLSLPSPVIASGVSALRHRFANQRMLEMTERIAAALGGIRRLYEDSSPRQNALEEALARRRLVLVNNPPEAYWEGQRIEVDWKRFAVRWRLLRALAGKVGRPTDVGERDVYTNPNSTTESLLSTTKGRLIAVLPATLGKLIVPGGQKRTYRLDLPPEQVHIVE